MDARSSEYCLVDRAKKGEAKAFEQLMTSYQSRIYRLLYRFLKHENDIDDVLQEVFLKAFRSLSGFRGDSLFYTWLYRIAVNTAKHYLQIKQQELYHLKYDQDLCDTLDLFLWDIETPEDTMIGKELAFSLESLIDSLPFELKEAFRLREMSGLSYQEISQAMNCPVGTVRSRIFRAREVLNSKLSSLI